MGDIINFLSPEKIVKMAEMKSELENENPPRERDRELRESLIMKYVRQHAGEVLELKDFGTAAGMTPSGSHAIVKSLLLRGLLIRKLRSNGKPGKSFAYYPANITPARAAEEVRVDEPEATFEDSHPEIILEQPKPVAPEPDPDLAWEYLQDPATLRGLTDAEKGHTLSVMLKFAAWAKKKKGESNE